MKLLIKPRVQKDKWSIYWKCSMSTKTEYLDEFTVDATPTMTAAKLKAAVAETCGWEPVDSLMRLDGFEEPWELAMYQGVELPSDATLEECGIVGDSTIICNRKVLVAEGWKMVSGGDDDSDTDDDDF